MTGFNEEVFFKAEWYVLLNDFFRLLLIALK